MEVRAPSEEDRAASPHPSATALSSLDHVSSTTSHVPFGPPLLMRSTDEVPPSDARPRAAPSLSLARGAGARAAPSRVVLAGALLTFASATSGVTPSARSSRPSVD